MIPRPLHRKRTDATSTSAAPVRDAEPAPRLGLRDLLSEALAGVLQRPGRSVLTTLGTVLGVGAFVAVLGLTSTAAGQISSRFSVLQSTTVTVNDTAGTTTSGAADPTVPPGQNPPMSFPADADARAAQINGVTAAGVWWPLPVHNATITSAPDAAQLGSGDNGTGLTVYAASAGAVRAMAPTVKAGVMFDPFDITTRQPVAILGPAAATRLGISRLDAQPAIFINGRAFTVIGIYSDTQRLPEALLGIIIPSTTALADFGNPDPSQGAQMLIATRIGAAPTVAHQIAVALRPDSPTAFQVIAPPDPHSLQDHVTGDLTGLFLALAAICLVVGAVGIANTTLVAVLERTEEIGLRRSLGARPRHIAAQFLTESVALGTLGGLIGTSLGVLTVLTAAWAKDWTAVLNPAAVLPSPFVGSAIGLLAGLYPALRAAFTDPLNALRHT